MPENNGLTLVKADARSNSDNAESIFGYLLQVTLVDTYTPLDWQGYHSYDGNPPE